MMIYLHKEQRVLGKVAFPSRPCIRPLRALLMRANNRSVTKAKKPSDSC